MIKRFPVFTDVRTTLISWSKSLANLADFPNSLKEVFSFGTWSPIFLPVGGMTYTPTTLFYARYLRIGSMLWVRLKVTGTTSGVAYPNILFTLPTGLASLPSNALPGQVVEYLPLLTYDATYQVGFGLIVDNVVYVAKHSAGNFTVGTNIQIIVNAIIEVLP